MATNTHIGYASRQAALNNALDAANSGTLVIYNGSQPANADTALSGQTALATFALANPAFAAAGGGSGSTTTKALNIPSAVAASATGTASWFRIYKSDAVTAVADGSVGTSSADLIVATTSFVSGATVTLTGTNQYSLPA